MNKDFKYFSTFDDSIAAIMDGTATLAQAQETVAAISACRIEMNEAYLRAVRIIEDRTPGTGRLYSTLSPKAVADVVSLLGDVGPEPRIVYHKETNTLYDPKGPLPRVVADWENRKIAVAFVEAAKEG